MKHTLMKDSINGICVDLYNRSVQAGWWTAKDGTPLQSNPYVFGQKLLLIHSEIAEATEGDRKDTMDSHLPHRKTVEVELADAFIRICDLAAAYGMDLGGAVVEKLAYNVTREDHKPKARAGAGGKKY